MDDQKPLDHDDPAIYRALAKRFREGKAVSEFNRQQAEAWDAYANRLESWKAGEGNRPAPPRVTHG